METHWAAKTDKKDAIKLANMAIDRWLDLNEYIPEDEIRQAFKICNRQYNQYNKLKTMLKNNLIALLDQTFPGVNNCLPHLPERPTAMKYGWTFLSNCDIVSAFADFLNGLLRKNISIGAERPDITTANTRQKIYTPLPAGTSACCQCATLRKY